MLLLYCDKTAAVVLGILDDTGAPVPASAYGSNIRIVPWAGARSDLQKAGPAPPPWASDTRLFAQPVETPAILINFAGQCRFNVNVAGLPFQTASGTVIQVNTGRGDAALINNLATHAAALQPTDPISFTQDGVAYPITAQDAINMFNAVMAQVQISRTIEANCIADLNSTTPSLRTYADVEAAFAAMKTS